MKTLPPGSDFFSVNLGNLVTGKYHFKIARALSITLYAFFVVLQPVSKGDPASARWKHLLKNII